MRRPRDNGDVLLHAIRSEHTSAGVGIRLQALRERGTVSDGDISPLPCLVCPSDLEEMLADHEAAEKHRKQNEKDACAGVLAR